EDGIRDGHVTGVQTCALPIFTVRSLSEAIGIKAADLTKKLFMQGVSATINTPLEPEVAEMIALEHGAELEVKKQLDVEDEVLKGDRKSTRLNSSHVARSYAVS